MTMYGSTHREIKPEETMGSLEFLSAGVESSHSICSDDGDQDPEDNAGCVVRGPHPKT